MVSSLKKENDLRLQLCPPGVTVIPWWIAAVILSATRGHCFALEKATGVYLVCNALFV